MKRGRLLIAVAVVVPAAFFSADSIAAPPTGVQWQTDLNKAQESSKTQQRPILLYVTADGCAYCHKMDRDTYSHPTIAGAIHDKFIPALVNASAHPNWVKQARINSFPVTMIVTAEGRIVDTLIGYADPAKLLRWLSEISQKETAANVMQTVER